MKTLLEVINEGKVVDLPNVKTIRHYTTLDNLIDILKDGFLLPNASKGDRDWMGYDIGANKVVSFHDSRYDTEWKRMLECNKMQMSLYSTKTLGLHMEEICACIEYDYDALPDDIKEKSTYIMFLKRWVPIFTKTWNMMIEISKSVNGSFEDDQMREFAARKNLKKYSTEESEELLDAAIHRRTQRMVNILLAHGWKKRDEKIMLYKFMSGSGANNFLEYIATHVGGKRQSKIPIEIRIASKVPIQLPCCRIYLFEGMVTGIAAEDWYDDRDTMGSFEILQEIIKKKRYKNIIYIDSNNEMNSETSL